MSRKKKSDSFNILARQKLKKRKKNPGSRLRMTLLIGAALSVVGSGLYFFEYSNFSDSEVLKQSVMGSHKSARNTGSKFAGTRKLGSKTSEAAAGADTTNILEAAKIKKKIDSMLISIKPGEKGRASDKEISRLQSLARKAANRNPDKILESISRALQTNSDYAKVQVFWNGSNSVVITTFKRKPFLVVMADKLRFLTKEGIVYGDASRASIYGSVGKKAAMAQLRKTAKNTSLRGKNRSTKSLEEGSKNLAESGDDGSDAGLASSKEKKFIKVSGIFKSRKSRRFVVKSDNSLKVRDDEKARIKEVIRLVQLSKQNKIEMTQIVFKQYRGFVSLIQKDNIEVSFGRAPFKARFVRLQNILDNLKHRGILYSKIELDYDGKAFIKEKRL